ncbi:hypothetical protein [Clostridium sp.]|uniref:retropepsin-like aspartic protease n=1 Tax=Clostridium sp. TaxID=1506 RepID=UPI003F676BDE
MKQRQKITEKTSTWLQKVILLAYDANLEQENAKMIICNTAQETLTSQILLKEYIWEKDIYQEYDYIVKEVDYIEKFSAMVENEKEMKLLTRAKKQIKKPYIPENVNKNSKKLETETKKDEAKMLNQVLKAVNKEKEDRFKEIKVNGEIVKAFLDQGSDVTIISREKCLERGLVEESCSEITLKIFFGLITTVNRKVSLTLTVDDVTITEECLIVETSTKEFDILLGLGTIRKIEKQRKELNQLTKRHQTLFDNSVSVGYDEIMCEISTPLNKKVNIKYRNIPHHMLEGASKTIDKMLEAGYIEPSTSSWRNPIRTVLKPTGEVRITSNMQFLNNLVEDNN